MTLQWDDTSYACQCRQAIVANLICRNLQAEPFIGSQRIPTRFLVALLLALDFRYRAL